MTCNFCSNGMYNYMILDKDNLCIQLNKNKLVVNFNLKFYNKSLNVVINYCPVCGKELVCNG